MKVLIVGGRGKADFLMNSLLDKKNSVTLIHDDEEYCRQLARKYDTTIICGDGTKRYILEEAEIENQDIVIALTPKDCANFVICQLAKKVYGIKRAFATVNNPKNVDVFKKLGIDSAISATYVVSNMIEQLATINDLSHLTVMESGHIHLMELLVKEQDPIVNQQIKDIDISEEMIISCIIRNSQALIPKGDTFILSGDKLIILSTGTQPQSFIGQLVGDSYETR